MDALVPLFLIFIALNSKQLAKDRLYRANVFAIVGIFYFVTLQYLFYWNRIFQVEGWPRITPVLIAVLVTIGICLSPWNKRSEILKTVSLVTLFVVALIGTYISDTSIKEFIADKGGFYGNGELQASRNSKASLGDVFEFDIGVMIGASSGWSKSELPSGHEYLLYEEQGKKVAEVRPNCLERMQVDTPTYLFRISDSLNSGKQNVHSSYNCGQSDGLKTCLVKVAYSTEGGTHERWHWFSEAFDGGAVVVDYVLAGGGEALKDEAAEMVESTRIVERRATDICRTPAAWL